MRKLLAATLCTFAIATATRAEAQPPAKPEPSPEVLKEAATHFDRGNAEYNEGNYRLALVEMQRAYDLAPHYRVLFNLAQIHAQLGDFTKAQSFFERYLAEGGDAVPAAKRAQVQKDLAALALKIGTLAFTVSEADADVLVDDKSIGHTPLTTALRVDAGDHRIRVEKDGFRADVRTVTLVGGEELKVDVKLEPSVVRGADLGPPHSSTPMWIGWGTTAVLGVGAGVTGAIALSASKDLKDIRDRPGASPSERDDAYNKTRTFGMVSTVVGVTAGVAGLVSIYLTIQHVSASRHVERAMIVPTTNGFQIQGSL
jgi:tetratricopeptide (TPR) repeat protein